MEDILEDNKMPHNKRMQSDHPIRYANGLAADAKRYAELLEIIRATSFFEAPKANNDFNIKSIETEGSPASIFATRDWLESIFAAKATWLKFFFNLRSLRDLLRASFISI